MAYKVSNNAFSTLAGAINSIATSLTVGTGHGDRFPVITGADHTFVTLEDASGNIEIVKVTARASASDVMTIVRAQDGTTARSWAAGDVVECRVIASLLNDAIAHAGDTTDAHAASAITNTPAGNIAATTVQAALNELDSELSAGIATANSNLTSHLNDTSDAHDASAISYAGGTGMSATDVEAAIDELATEKMNLAGGTLTGNLTMSGASIITAEGASVTAASTTNIWTLDGNTRHVIGNTTITSFGTAPQAGARMKLIFDGTPLLTQSANLNLNGGGDNIQIEADDWAEVYADTTTQFDVVVHKKNGKAIVESITSLVVLQTASTFDGAVATGTATIPKDDSIPQDTEGTQFMSLSFTPVSAASTLLIEACIYISNSLAAQPTIAALFLSGTADAIGVGHMLNSNAAQPTLITLSAKIASGSTSAKTFTVRAGSSAAATVTFNGASGARLFGGVFSSFIKVTEYI